MNNAKKFRILHQQEKMLHIGSIWNAKSALIFEKMGYQALGTSSAAIADALGYEDGEQIDFDDILYIVKSILKKVSIPLTVDVEAGYSRNEDEIVKNILKLAKAGVVGINLEDYDSR